MDVSRLEPWVAEARQRYRTAEDMVTGVLWEAIVTGVFSPGERLPQDQLAELLMVSRMPIRAGLRLSFDRFRESIELLGREVIPRLR